MGVKVDNSYAKPIVFVRNKHKNEEFYAEKRNDYVEKDRTSYLMSITHDNHP
jgi:hypothetical protein